MSELNHERLLVREVERAASRRGIRVEHIAQGWILRLQRGQTTRHVHGYTFDLNPAATSAIACDKAATSAALAASGLAHVEHRLFLHPSMARFGAHAGNWDEMLRYFELCDRDVVVKDNLGTGGRGVHRARSRVALEAAVLGLFERGQSVAMCPFVEIGEEARFVVLAGVCEAAYTKVRPTVHGDGRRTVLELLADQITRSGLTRECGRLLANLEPDSASVLREVPASGEVRLLNWRHNLGQGATLTLIDPLPSDPRAMLAAATATALNLRFGSVDVVTVGGRPMVLEVNSGVMMEALAATPGGGQLAARVYDRAVGLMFDTEEHNP